MEPPHEEIEMAEAADDGRKGAVMSVTHKNALIAREGAE